VKALFWFSSGLLAYAQVGYGALLALLARLLDEPRPDPDGEVEPGDLPTVSVIVAAYAEQDVIGGRVENLRGLDYPRDRYEIVVACDGSADATAARAREAGADAVLELPRGGKIRAQDAAVARSEAEIVAFSDANALWEPDALTELVKPFAHGDVGYVCGQVRFVNEHGDNQEGVYWRYEMMLRRHESSLRSITGGNGAIYATRRDVYLNVDPIMGHDLSFPFNIVKRGRRAVYAPAARATEKMVPTIEGEFARKRRMMSHAWPIVIRGGLLSPRGYDPLYALMIFSHRVLRYASPFLHVTALASSTALSARRATRAPVYAAATVTQLALLAGAAAATNARRRPFLIARYYVLTTASLAAGLYDWLRHGTPAGWEPAEGTR
jgi:cellulose synthase/poly-beta-1,6-N-acetylglucosamine synthase-like glycosyltransferase